MINFFYETAFIIKEETRYEAWVEEVVSSEEKTLKELNFIFCDDEYLLKINQEYLGHDAYTDIITFVNDEGKNLQSDIFISVERVKDNAAKYEVSFEEELKRVMAHGILHLVGYNDKEEEERRVMREKEEEKINMFHVEQ